MTTTTTLTKRQGKIVDIYTATYPHLSTLAGRAKGGDVRSAKALGDAMARLAYPTSITGLDALEIAKIGME